MMLGGCHWIDHVAAMEAVPQQNAVCLPVKAVGACNQGACRSISNTHLAVHSLLPPA